MNIMKSLNRRVSWLMAEKSFDKPIIGFLAKLIGAVPVSRAMDSIKTAEGTVHLPDPSGNPRLLAGIGTKFDGPGVEVGGSIYLPAINGESQKLDIAEICGAEKIILKVAPTAKDVLHQLSQPAGTSFKVAPHVDQTEVYNAVFERLRRDGCIGIFPEGGSHDRPDMLPLKGTSRSSSKNYILTAYSRNRNHGARWSLSKYSYYSHPSRYELLSRPQIPVPVSCGVWGPGGNFS
jgi:glycerol-3-phosphate O-acyltransferase/dihydroxyacetone phosphate acyltransferase